MFVELILGPLHDEEARQYVDEDSPYPWRHFMCLGRPEVDVEHQNRHTYTAAAAGMAGRGGAGREEIMCVKDI